MLGYLLFGVALSMSFSSSSCKDLEHHDVLNGNAMRFQVSVFLSVLGLTVLPISAVVGNYISNIYEDR